MAKITNALTACDATRKLASQFDGLAYKWRLAGRTEQACECERMARMLRDEAAKHWQNMTK